MATKIFKRTNGKDVFDKLADPDDPIDMKPASEDAPIADNTTQLESREPAEEAEATDEVPDAGDADEEVATPSHHRRWLRRVLVAAIGAVVVAALGTSGFLGWQLKEQRDTAAAGRAALAVAQNYAVALTSIDTKKVDQNFTQVLDGATGEFKDMYSQSASQLRQLLIDNKATSQGIVVDSAIKSATKARVEVLLFIDQTISNSVNPQPRIDRNRVAMTMELIDNHWLASKVDIK